MSEEQVILVNENNEPIGLMPKMEAHEKGILHRAFSVFIFNDQNQLMLQQRARSKYHSPGLWTNTCCSHQRVGESNIQAGQRRLQEEMGFNTELKDSISFIYKASFDNGLTEHELDHILIGNY
ncbi:MAG: isopentenyl-diphosphate Delta-isomerase, partial [Bacteroidetes bacterium]|nr:isopentenyl-diphosphate Delta-isomerase [Bacteroidota bacterium]